MSRDPQLGRVIVCVPARNEAAHLPLLLGSLAAQSHLDAGYRLKVVVVSNNSSDATSAAVRAVASAEKGKLDLRLLEIDLPSSEAHVGTARRIAMDAAADWLEGCGISDGIILTTDADALAPASWVASNVEALKGADAVGGRLVMAPQPGQPPAMMALHRRVEDYWRAVRALEDVIDPPPEDPAPRHGDHTAASLAVRASIYRQVGGLPALRSGEDNALVARIRSIGGRVRHAPEVSIVVSPRETGRAEGGMAEEMTRRRITCASGCAYEVPTAAYWLSRLLLRARHRAAWVQREGALGASPAGGPVSFPNLIAYLHHCDASLTAPAPTQPLEMAIAGLETCRRDALLAQTAAE